MVQGLTRHGPDEVLHGPDKVLHGPDKVEGSKPRCQRENLRQACHQLAPLVVLLPLLLLLLLLLLLRLLLLLLLLRPLQGDKPACIALTDTQLLLGGSSGIVQHFDLFSGRRQLITKHSSGVTCIRVLKQQHKQHHALPGDPEDSIAIIGCMDGQVRCGCAQSPSIMPTAVGLTVHHARHSYCFGSLLPKKGCAAHSVNFKSNQSS